MGKKDKKKGGGAIKTAAKTEKKLESKRKKELAALGEEDIENVIASIEKEEAKRNAVIEKTISSLSPRVSSSLSSHPTNTSELVLFGGEHHDGQKTFVYNGLFIYNITKNEWRVIKAPNAPPPRSAHQAVTLSSNKGELWIFGGEFTSQTELQFYHYKDLWVFNFGDRKWQKVESAGAPSPRSGHRMTSLKRTLVVFGGYNDNGRNYKYFNDVHVFCTDSRIWKKIDTTGIPPSPRSACLLMPSGQESLIVYGGYTRIKEGKQDKGITHSDQFKLSAVQNKNNSDNTTNDTVVQFKWESLKGGSQRPSPPRNSFSTCFAPVNKAYVFGGIQDIEDTDESLMGEMFNTLHCIDLDTGLWKLVNLKPIKVEKPVTEDSSVKENNADNDQIEEDKPVTVCSDGVFTMTLSAAKSSSSYDTSVGNQQQQTSGFVPSPRMNAMIAVQKSIIYLYGGLVEKGEKQFTLSDMYSLDLHKLDTWKTIIPQTGLPEWLGSDSEDDDDEEGSENSEESPENSEDSD